MRQPTLDDLHSVTMETDGGPVDLTFGYAASGDPAYSDVPAFIGWRATQGAAELDGALLVQVGNWRSFTVEKRWFGQDA